MILQEEFEKNGYIDLITISNTPSEYEIDLEALFETGQKPKELLHIYMSETKDDLFLILDGSMNNNDLQDSSRSINSLCKSWDERIRVFTIIEAKKIYRLKYNIVQLIICSRDMSNRSIEGDLLISRKIIIKGDLSDRNHIVIDDDDAIELPFYMISEKEFEPDGEKIRHLNRLLPEDENCMKLMEKEHYQPNRNNKSNIQVKSFQEDEFKMIKEWLDK